MSSRSLWSSRRQTHTQATTWHHVTTGATEHRSEAPKKGQEDFLEEVTSKLSATREKDTRGTRPLSRQQEPKLEGHTENIRKPYSLGKKTKEYSFFLMCKFNEILGPFHALQTVLHSRTTQEGPTQ